MRWYVAVLGLLAVYFLCGFAPLNITHDTTQKVDDEINQIYNEAQPLSFRVQAGTPTLKDMQDGEVVIVASNTWVRFMFRTNQEIYSINPSCVTVRR